MAKRRVPSQRSPGRTTRRALRGGQIQRVLLEIGDLVRSPWRLPDLARHIGVTWRTLYRDLDALRAIGIRVYSDGRRGSGVLASYRIDRKSVRRVLGL